MNSTIRDEFVFLPKSKIKAGEGTEDGRFPFFTSSDVKTLRIDVSLYNDEAVILGTGGKPSCNYYCGDFSVSTDNFVLSSKGRVLPKYLYYYLRTDGLSKLEKGFKGAGLKHISKEYVQNIVFPVRPLSQQKEIINELDAVVLNIENSKRQISLLDEQVKSLFNELISSFNGSWILASDIGTFKNGMNFSANDHGYNVPCVSVGSFKNLSHLTDPAIIPTATLSSAPDSDYLLKDGDLLFVRSNGNKALVGRCVMSLFGNCEMVYSGFVIRFRRNDERFRNEFLLHFFRADDTRQQLQGRGANIQNLNQTMLGKVRVPLIELAAQDCFVTRVEQINKLRFKYQRQIELLNELMEKKMEEYFGGDENA